MSQFIGLASARLPRIALYGTLHAVLSSVYLPGSGFGRGFETVSIARALARTGRFADPYDPLRTGLTAHTAPLYPAYLSLLIRIAGDGQALAFLAVIVSGISFGLFLAMWPAFAERALGNRSIGVGAAIAAICIPLFQISPQTETIWLATALIGFCLLSLTRVRSWETAVLSGLVAGLATLVNPASTAFMALWLIGLAALNIWRPKQVFVAAAIAFLVTCPVMLRNFNKLGTFAIRDDFGLELQLNNNDLAQATAFGNTVSLLHFSPTWNRDQAQQVKDLGEKAYNQAKLREAQRWIENHPSRFMRLTLERYILFWFPDYHWLPFNVGVWLITALSIPAMISAVRTRSGIESLLVICSIGFSLPYCLVNGDIRYRTPILWVSLLFAAKAVISAVGKPALRSSVSLSPSAADPTAFGLKPSSDCSEPAHSPPDMARSSVDRSPVQPARLFDP